MKTWRWKCAQCEYTMDVPEGTIPDIDPEKPHAKDGMLLSTDQMKEVDSWCHSIEFRKI